MPEAELSRSIDDGAGREWLIDAYGCCPRRLADSKLLEGLLSEIIADLQLHPLCPGIWHQFPWPGGLTGMYLLTESHLTCHTWPETGTAAFNLFCCRPRPDWPWALHLQERLQAKHVDVRVFERGGRGRLGP